jgi:glycosyltransferase involved in cell wall biosynthesis
MKLIIQIPAYNEEQTLPLTLSKLPKEIDGIETIETLIIDDGSNDNTIEVARKCGVTHIVSTKMNKGLAKAFKLGLDTCLKKGADIIVNTDADNQYNADDIKLLVDPIIKNTADIVIGERPILEIKHFSIFKKILQKLGSLMVRKISNTEIQDAPSGFRAFSREAALSLNIFSSYTYTLETIIQAGKKGIAIKSIPIRINKDERPSKLVKSNYAYIKKSIITMIRIFNTYRPLSFFLILGTIPLIIGISLGVRWIILFLGSGTARSIPSLILSAICIIIGTQLFIFGLIADLISTNRQLLEDIQKKVREVYYK